MAVVTPLSDLEVASNMVLNLQTELMRVSALTGFEKLEITVDGTTIKGDKPEVLAKIRQQLSYWRSEYHRIQRAADIAAGLTPATSDKILVRFL